MNSCARWTNGGPEHRRPCRATPHSFVSEPRGPGGFRTALDNPIPKVQAAFGAARHAGDFDEVERIEAVLNRSKASKCSSRRRSTSAARGEVGPPCLLSAGQCASTLHRDRRAKDRSAGLTWPLGMRGGVPLDRGPQAPCALAGGPPSHRDRGRHRHLLPVRSAVPPVQNEEVGAPAPPTARWTLARQACSASEPSKSLMLRR
jgi:hypothetical protein